MSLTCGSTLPMPSSAFVDQHKSLKPLKSRDFRGDDSSTMSKQSGVSSTDSVSLLEIPPQLRLRLSKSVTSPSAQSEVSSKSVKHVGSGGVVVGGGMDGGEHDNEDINLDVFESDMSLANFFGGSVVSADELKARALKHKTLSFNGGEINDDLVDTHAILASKPMSAGDSSVLLRIYTPKQYEEILLLRCLTIVEPHRLLCERKISIDQAFDNVALASQTAKSTTQEDLQSLRSMLVSMFEEADVDNNAYLTYDEFQGLMERIEVGITPQELRFVIAEADENENGFIDYHEFVPLAVDMIQAFRARTRAIRNQEMFESSLEDEILNRVSHEDVGKLSEIFFEEVKQVDLRKSGALRASEIRKVLKKMAYNALTNSEINMICQSLPRDSFGRLMYKDFQKILYQTKIGAMRNMMLESQGNDIHRYLITLFRNEEMRLYEADTNRSSAGSVDSDNIPLYGTLPLRSIINVMMTSPRLSLSRLQVMVIASEAHLNDYKVNYMHFAPIAAKTIEIMFEPKALRMRAELIESTDLSPEVLLKGDSSEEFTRRLKTLFKSYDIDRTGELNAKQFRACMETMDLELSVTEIQTLMTIADENCNGSISFDEFSEFCMNNLLHLEREKHIRLLQREINGKSKSVNENSSESKKSLEIHIHHIFELADTDKSGFLSYLELEHLFCELDIKLTPFQVSILMSEFDSNEDGLVGYQEFIPICVDLIENISAKSFADDERIKREEMAEIEVTELSASWEMEVRHVSEVLYRQLLVVATIADVHVQRRELLEVLKNPLNGLSRTEVNLMASMLLNQKDNNMSMDELVQQSLRIPKDLIQTEKMIRGRKTEVVYKPLQLESEDHLLEMIKYVRKMTVMRGILNTVEPNTIAKQLLVRFTDEAEKIRKEKNDFEPVCHLPVQKIIKVLETIPTLNLRQEQIMSLVSWSDAFHSPGIGIDYRQFAFYAGDVIAKLRDKTELEKRKIILSNPNVDANSALKGCTQDEIEKFLELAIKESTLGEMTGISDQMLFDALTNIPRLNLSDKEAASIYGSVLSNNGSETSWRSIKPYLYPSVRSVCMERMISRRVKLLGASSCVLGEYEELQKIADRLLDTVSIKKKGNNYAISFKTEGMKGPRRSSLLPVSLKKSPGEITTESILVSKKAPVHPMEDVIVKDSYDILRTGRFVPLRAQKPRSSNPANKSAPITFSKSQIQNGLFLLIRVSENDPIQSPDKPPLHLSGITCDGEYAFNLPLNIRLPSLGLVDQEAANQFALNIINNVYLRYSDKNVLELHFHHSFTNSS